MSGRNANATTRHDVNAAVRAAKALNLRKLGATYDHIATQCGYRDRGAAYHAVQRELKRTIQEPADDVRKLEAERLDALMMAQMPKALKGDTYACDRVLRIMDRRASLLGLDLTPPSAVASLPVQRDYFLHESQVPKEPAQAPTDGQVSA